MATSTELLYEKFGEIEVNIIFSIACFATCAIAVGFYAAIIYFEAHIDDHVKTLINQLYTLLFSYVILFLICLNVIDILRTMYGPLPIWACMLYAAGVQGCSLAFCIGLMQAIVAKYLYCCILKSFGALDDKLYFYYCVLLNGFITLYLTGAMLYANMIPLGPMGYCSSLDPKTIIKPVIYHSALPFYVYVFWLALIIHAILNYQIRKVEGSILNHRRAVLHNWINIFILIFIAIFVSIIVMKMGKQKSKNDLNLPRPFANIVIGCGILAYSYFTHPHLRKFSLRRHHSNV